MQTATTSWNTAVIATDEIYRTLQQQPKAELHTHAGGAFPPPFLFRIASETQKQKLTQFVERLKKGEQYAEGMQYEEVFAVFPLISSIVNTNQKIEEGTFCICEELKADGVSIAEIRSGLKKLEGEDEEVYLQALLQGISRATSAHFKGAIILSVQRDSTPEFVQKTVELAIQYKDRGVVGIDISGDSTKGTIQAHLPMLKCARKAGLFITAHIGESFKETDQMLILQELEPHRVGHAVCLSTEATQWIKKHKIPVEVCPTSAKLTRMHEIHVIHPWILEHRDNNHPIVICTDDPTVFGVSLTDEYYGLRDFLRIDQIQEIANSSFKHAFMKL